MSDPMPAAAIRPLDRPGLLARVQKIFSRPARIEQAGKFSKAASTALSLALVFVGSPLLVNVGYGVHEHFSGPERDAAVYATQVSVAKDVIQRGLDGLNTQMDVAIVRDRIEHLPRRPDNFSWGVSLLYSLDEDKDAKEMSANVFREGVKPGVPEESACLIMTPKDRKALWVEEGLYGRLADRIARTYDVSRDDVLVVLRAAHTANAGEELAGHPQLTQQLKLFAAAHTAGHEAGHCVDLAAMTEGQKAQIYTDPVQGAYRFESVSETLGLMAAYRVATAVEGGAPASEVQKWVEDVAVQRIQRNDPESFVAPNDNVYAYRNAGFASLAAIEAIRTGEKTAEDSFSRTQITENIERGRALFMDQDRQLQNLALRSSMFEADDPAYVFAERMVDGAFSPTPQRCDYVGNDELACAPLKLVGDEAIDRLRRLDAAFETIVGLQKQKEEEKKGDLEGATKAAPPVSVSLGGGVLGGRWNADPEPVSQRLKRKT